MSRKCEGLHSDGPSPWRCPDCSREWTLLAGWRVTDDPEGGDKPLPTTDEFIGSDPDFTGGKTTQEYMDWLRGTAQPEGGDKDA